MASFSLGYSMNAGAPPQHSTTSNEVGSFYGKVVQQDVDGDGKLDTMFFAGPGTVVKHDVDGDGVLTQEDIAQLSADFNGDGSVTQAEIDERDAALAKKLDLDRKSVCPPTNDLSRFMNPRVFYKVE